LKIAGIGEKTVVINERTGLTPVATAAFVIVGRTGAIGVKTVETDARIGGIGGTNCRIAGLQDCRIAGLQKGRMKDCNPAKADRTALFLPLCT
jgi:hypothetical protein